ncbi:MAG: MarC family protein [Planctomycetes bacterium]|jgi:multiple antibiotic resistance protein|nr:MarC family protein [Planctomycetota bacterium]
MDIFSTALLLFLVIDPVGNIPAFLFVLRSVPEERHRQILVRELVLALGALMGFLFSGQYILAALQVSQGSLGAAGGIILFLIAVRMVFPVPKGVFGEEAEIGEPFIVPLAIPLIAGPAAMATLMLLMARAPEKWPQWLVALFLAWSVSGVILLSADRLAKLLGRRTLTAIERLMGLVLTAVAVQMFIDGVGQAYRGVAPAP